MNYRSNLGILLAASFWLSQQMLAQEVKQPPDGSPNPQSATPQIQKIESPPSVSAQPTSGTTGNTSQGPSQPVTTYPGGQPATPTAGVPPSAPQPRQQAQDRPKEPQGAAAAEKVPKAGISAAKPAGVAIAPAKQHRTRSLLIKFGAVAAAGIAGGTIYALSRGTASTPPGAGTSGVPK